MLHRPEHGQLLKCSVHCFLIRQRMVTGMWCWIVILLWSALELAAVWRLLSLPKQAPRQDPHEANHKSTCLAGVVCTLVPCFERHSCLLSLVVV